MTEWNHQQALVIAGELLGRKSPPPDLNRISLQKDLAKILSHCGSADVANQACDVLVFHKDERWVTTDALARSIDRITPSKDLRDHVSLPNHSALSGPVKGLEPIEQWRTGAIQKCLRFLGTPYGKQFEETGFPWTAEQCRNELAARGVQ